MNRQLRILGLVGILMMLLTLAACDPPEPPTPVISGSPIAVTLVYGTPETTPTRELGANSINRIDYQVTLDQTYAFINPGGRWNLGGRDLTVVGYPSTVIRIALEDKPEGASFSEALTTLTDEPLMVVTEEGITYAEGTNSIGAHLIYRDTGDGVLVFMLLDAVDETVQDLYLDDWREIALTGALIAMD